MHTIIYEAISDSTFNEIKGEATAALVWKKLVAVMTGKGDLVREHLLTRLGNMACSDEGNMQRTIGVTGGCTSCWQGGYRDVGPAHRVGR